MEAQQRAEIGKRIRDLREASPETNRSIADYVGVGERSVANWIAGETGITYRNAKKVAELFSVDVRWLWDGRERENAPDVLGALSASTATGDDPPEWAQKLLDQQATLLAGMDKVLDEQARLRKLQERSARTAARKRK